MTIASFAKKNVRNISYSNEFQYTTIEPDIILSGMGNDDCYSFELYNYNFELCGGVGNGK